MLVGAERHDTLDLALRYLGLGTPTPVPADGQGRISVEALAEALDGIEQWPDDRVPAGRATCTPARSTRS